MKKLNWGTKLGMMASLYVIGVLIFVGFSTTQKINLVSKDYYPSGVKHQDQINKIKNAHHMQNPVVIEELDDAIQIIFPEEMRTGVNGKVVLYRPADYESDMKFKLKLDDNGIYSLSTDQLLNGRYTLKLDWTHKDVPYYKEEAIYLSK
jgi:hypothetical protein